jgi:hypothetical protein
LKSLSNYFVLIFEKWPILVPDGLGDGKEISTQKATFSGGRKYCFLGGYFSVVHCGHSIWRIVVKLQDCSFQWRPENAGNFIITRGIHPGKLLVFQMDCKLLLGVVFHLNGHGSHCFRAKAMQPYVLGRRFILTLTCLPV